MARKKENLGRLKGEIKKTFALGFMPEPLPIIEKVIVTFGTRYKKGLGDNQYKTVDIMGGSDLDAYAKKTWEAGGQDNWSTFTEGVAHEVAKKHVYYAKATYFRIDGEIVEYTLKATGPWAPKPEQTSKFYTPKINY